MVQALTRLEALERREGTTASLVEKLFGRVERLEEQNRQLELRNARLTRTVRALQQTNGAVGADGALPADEPPPTLDMLPDEALARVGSFVGTRDLRRLALVSRRFTKRRRAAAAGIVFPVTDQRHACLLPPFSTVGSACSFTLPVLIFGVPPGRVLTRC